jgi:excisionase family DNA binding protein
MNELLETIQRNLCAGEPHVNVRVAAAHFGVSVWSIYRMAESGKIPSFKVGGKRSFKISELESAFRR